MVDRLQITDRISIPMEQIEMQAVRSQGAGGQNVNKVATAIHLRFDYANCDDLPADVRNRIAALDDHRVTASGIVIKAQEYRRQSRNRSAALERLRQLLLDAMLEQKPRIATRPSRRAVAKRIAQKRRQGELKRSRARPKTDPPD